MTSLKDIAKAFQPPVTHNISELDKVPLSAELHYATKQDSEGKDFEYNYIVINEVEYRVPNPVVEQVKTLLKANPALEYVTVHKTGEGIKTRYSVDPITH